MHILLVGLGAEPGAIVTRLLTARGHAPVVASGGVRALELLGEAATALVVAADPLVDMSAEELCRRARAAPGGRSAVLLVLILREDDDAQARLVEAGASDVHFIGRGAAGLQARLLIAERLVNDTAILQDREYRFRRLFDACVAAITISNVDGDLKEANDAFLRMVGYSREDLTSGALTRGTMTPHGGTPSATNESGTS
jgi:PAS domain-containing protein